MKDASGKLSALLLSVKSSYPALYRWAQILVPSCLLAGTMAVSLAGGDWVEMAQFKAFDAFIRVTPRLYRDAPVRIVDIDEKSLELHGQWPWPRAVLGKFVDRLMEEGASVVAFDMVFPEPDRLGPGQDKAFAAAIARGRVVLGVPTSRAASRRPPMLKANFAERGELAHFALQYPGLVTNLSILETAAAGLGTFSTVVERDGVIRRVPMVLRVGEDNIPGLALEALRVAMGASNFGVKSSLTDSRGRQATGIEKIKVGDLILPTDEQARVWNYPTRESSQRVIPAWAVLQGKVPAGKLEGCIAFIGTSAEGLRDIRATALNPAAAGVEVHANLAEQALLGEFLERPDWAVGAEALSTLLFGILLIVLLARFGSAWCFPLFLAALAWSIGMPFFLFRAKGYLLDPVFPALSALSIYMASSLISYLKTEFERRQVKGAFSRYMAPALVDELAKHPEKLALGGETREMTWHFCDIRGFTTISEQFDPQGLVKFINRFLTPMTEIILKHQGVIDKYMGDCIMAFWNAPLDDPQHVRHACLAALEMHAKLAELNVQWEAQAAAEGRKFIPIHIGTGLNTGSCVVGNMGSDQRFDYSVLGDEVNLASRLEGQSKTYGVNIVIGPNTRAQAADFAALELDLLKVKGKTVPVRIFALLGGPELARDESFKTHAELHGRMITAYRAARFDEAGKLLSECRKSRISLETLYDLYEERLSVFAAEPPAKDWDGTFTATSK